MAQKDVGNKVPIYKLKKTEEVMKYYDEWGEGNKYDKDMVDWNYTGPKETSAVLQKKPMCPYVESYPPLSDQTSQAMKIPKRNGLIKVAIRD